MKDNEYVDFVVTARKYKTLLTNKYIHRSVWKKHEQGEVISNLPGTVLEIPVEIGQRVKEGELIMILEAMKMQNRVIAPVSGIIKDIYINKGDKIGKNHLMIKIEPK